MALSRRFIAGVVIATAVLGGTVVALKRALFRPNASASRIAGGSPERRRPVIFIGLDGADWGLLDDYMRRGIMPNLAALAAAGSAGVVRTIDPPLSPLVW